VKIPPARRPALRLFAADSPRYPGPTARTEWKINGFAASVQVWTAEEWSRLASQPDDAQRSKDGSWHALRMD
jgi:hypothetical protein